MRLWMQTAVGKTLKENIKSCGEENCCSANLYLVTAAAFCHLLVDMQAQTCCYFGPSTTSLFHKLLVIYHCLSSCYRVVCPYKRSSRKHCKSLNIRKPWETFIPLNLPEKTEKRK